MKEPYIEGVATHDDPESCAGSREGASEALTGVHTGRVLSREIISTGTLTPLTRAESHTSDVANARHGVVLRGRRPLARAESSCARTGRSLSSPATESVTGCIGKAKAVRR